MAHWCPQQLPADEYIGESWLLCDEYTKVLVFLVYLEQASEQVKNSPVYLLMRGGMDSLVYILHQQVFCKQIWVDSLVVNTPESWLQIQIITQHIQKNKNPF